ncbi:MAG: hypothetical protein Fur0035_13480 [Anaerolineales bacterium]
MTELVDEKTRQHWRMAFGALPFPVILLSAQGEILHANPRFSQKFGFDESQQTIRFCDAAEREKMLSALRRQRSLENYDLRALSADGRPLWVSLSAYPFQIEGGEAFIISIFDITRDKQTEMDFARQVERLNALYAVDQAVISSLDLNIILSMLVEKAVSLLEVDAATVLLLDKESQTLNFAARRGFRTEATKFTSLALGEGLAGQAGETRAIVHIPNLQKLDDNPSLKSAIAGEQFVSYFGIPLTVQGELLGVMEIFHRSQLAPSPDWLTFLQTLAGQAAIAIHNARMMEATRQSLQEINSLYQINQELIASLDADTLMENVAGLLQANFGYFYVQIFVRDPQSGNFLMRAGSGELGRQLKSAGYHLAAGEGLVGFTAETGKPFFTNNVEEVISFERPPFLSGTRSELAVPIRADGQFLGLLDVHQAPPALLSERDLRLVSSVADQLALALQKANLYTDLQESLRREQETRAQLVHNEKLTVAGRLLASVSHELNNPIQAIQNALFLLKEESGLSQQGRQDLELVLAETDRMAAMLQRLRGTYLPAGYSEFAPVQTNNLIDEVCMLVATHLRHSHISFEFHSEPGLPPVLGVEDQLRQVILNLVINAVDAMPQGGQLLIATQFLPAQREVLMTVSDTGGGIDVEILPKIFEAFVTTKERGSGLGLNICSQIIQAHGGRIAARNNSKAGATLSVWLPAAGQETL